MKKSELQRALSDFPKAKSLTKDELRLKTKNKTKHQLFDLKSNSLLMILCINRWVSFSFTLLLVEK